MAWVYKTGVTELIGKWRRMRTFNCIIVHLFLSLESIFIIIHKSHECDLLSSCKTSNTNPINANRHNYIPINFIEAFQFKSIWPYELMRPQLYGLYKPGTVFKYIRVIYVENEFITHKHLTIVFINHIHIFSISIRHLSQWNFPILCNQLNRNCSSYCIVFVYVFCCV